MSALDLLLGPREEPLPWPLPHEHLSKSSLGRYAKCPEQWRRHYALLERTPPGVNLLWGSVDHATHEVNFLQKIETHEDLSLDDIGFVFAEKFEEQVEEYGGHGEVQWLEDEPTDVFNRGLRLAQTYHQQVSPTIQPVGVEENFGITIPRVPVPVIGRTDIRTADRLIDGKTTGQKTARPKADWWLQAAIYQQVSKLPLEFHVKTRTKNPAVYTAAEEPGLYVPFNPVQIETQTRLIQMLVADLAHNWEVYGPNEPWPTHAPFASNWACLPQYCGYRVTCSHWRQ